MDVFKIIYTAFGGLSLFFYGMRNMTDGLQALGGDVIKRIIGSLTSNRFLAVLVGLGVTTIVQSSSITTVMTVGFVNSGLMSLTQAIGVIFGANIGTTITGWIISIKIGKYGLLMIGLSLYPTLYAKSEKWRQIGRVVFGIGLIFFGLQLMSGAFKPLRTYPAFIESLHYFSGHNYMSYVYCIIMGCLLTIIIQSSSAMLGITIALAASGVIEFHTAAALVLGENIGTTITALLAGIGGNINAKRAAKAHAIFNLFGVGIMVAIFPYYVQFIEWLIPNAANFVNEAGDRPYIAFHIASGHTIFNVAATLIFLPFLKQFSNLIVKLTPEKVKEEDSSFTLLGNKNSFLPATAIIQAQQELLKFKDVVNSMFDVTRSIFETPNNDDEAIKKIKRYEQITDNIEREVTVYMCQVMEKRLSPDQSAQAQSIVRVADELESLGDYLEKLVMSTVRLKNEGALKGALKEEFSLLLKEVETYFEAVSSCINEPSNLEELSIYKTSDEIKAKIDEIREGHVERISKKEYSPLTALTYSDMVVSLRKIRSHTLNIAQAYTSKTA